jgi:hypothetical protein
MSKTRVSLIRNSIAFGLLALAFTNASASSSQIQAQQKPGQFEILEGSALQLRAQEPKQDKPTGYQWRIIDGDGGKLMNADTLAATFYAPKVTADVQLYQVQLATTFADGKTTKASVLVRVHKRPAKSAKTGKKVVYRNSGPWLGFGFGFGMGYLWDYPIYVPIIIPIPPNEVWPPDLQPPVEPQPFTAEDMTDLPAELQPADIYDAEDFGLLADQLPELTDLNVDSYDSIDSVDNSGDMSTDDAMMNDMMIEGEVLDEPAFDDYTEPMIDEPMMEPMMNDSMMDYPMMDDMDF